MNGRTHLIVGLATGIAIASQIKIDPVQQLTTNAVNSAFVWLGVIVAAGFGSLLPDIDHPRSVLSGWLPGAGLLRLGTRHRGLTHSVIPLMVVALAVLVSTMPGKAVNFAIMAGMISHLILDMLTPEGVQLFYPLRGFWRFPALTLVPVWLWESLLTTGALVGIGGVLWHEIHL